MTSLESRKASLAVIEGAVCKDRTATHGPPENNFADIATLWSFWVSRRHGVEVKLDALDVAEMCSLLKTARKLMNIEVLDHWDDAAGYNVCGAGLLRQRQAAPKDAEPPKPVSDMLPSEKLAELSRLAHVFDAHYKNARRGTPPPHLPMTAPPVRTLDEARDRLGLPHRFPKQVGIPDPWPDTAPASVARPSSSTTQTGSAPQS